jgi:hypothetical protein
MFGNIFKRDAREGAHGQTETQIKHLLHHYKIHDEKMSVNLPSFFSHHFSVNSSLFNLYLPYQPTKLLILSINRLCSVS